MPTYDEAMKMAEAEYRDVLDALHRAEIPASMTQTGGMCLAIHIPWGERDWFWLTDKESELSWNRREEDGWALGFYQGDDENMDQPNGPWDEFLTSDFKRPETAVALVMDGIKRAVSTAPFKKGD